MVSEVFAQNYNGAMIVITTPVKALFEPDDCNDTEVTGRDYHKIAQFS